MRKFTLKIITIFLWIWFFVSSVILTPVMVIVWAVTGPFDRRLFVLHKLSCFWGAQYIWVNPFWKLKIENRQKFNDSSPWIVISNHQSLVDIVVIYSLFKHFKWTSKAENFKTPFVGWVLAFNRSIRVYRASRDAYSRFRSQAAKAIKEGNPLMLFPEGTRSRDGKLGRFKEGAFLLAHEMQTGIIPMVLDGSARAVPKKGWSLTGKTKIILRVLDPVPYKAFSDLTPADTAIKFRTIISDELEKIRK